MNIYKLLYVVPIVVLSLVLWPVLAMADSTPDITTVIQDGSNQIVTSVPAGTTVTDNVTVASSTATSSIPLGTVDFTMFPNTICSGVGTTQSGVSLVNGVAESATTTATGSGLSYLVQYNGQEGLYASTTSPCEPLAVTVASSTPTSTSINTALSTTSALVGTSVFDTATLSGTTANASGTVAYSVFANSTCDSGVFDAGTVQVANSSVPNSNSFQFNDPGSFYWQAMYSGDANNAAATSSCQNEVVTINATSTATTTPGTGSISGTVYNDTNRSGSKDSGEPLLSGWTINLYSGAGLSGQTNKTPVMTTTSDANGNYSFVNLADGTYSIEEINQPSLNQFTSDYNSVAISGGSVLQNYDFGNVAGNPNDNSGGGGGSNGGQHKNDKGDNPVTQHQENNDNGGHGNISHGHNSGRGNR